MPEFIFRGQRFQSPVELALHAVGGKWKMPTLWRLNQRSWGSEYRRKVAAAER